jgi:tRNA 2-thiouridine synthesizing protein A
VLKHLSLFDHIRRSTALEGHVMKAQCINTIGLKCPQPTLRLAVMCSHMDPGDTLEVIGDCPTFEQDIRHWCERLDKQVLSVEDDGKGEKRIQIQF